MAGDRERGRAPTLQRGCATPTRVALVGPPTLLDVCAPMDTPRLRCRSFEARQGAAEAIVGSVRSFAAEAVVVIDPSCLPCQTVHALAALPGLTLGMLTDGVPEGEAALAAGALQRVVSFDPALTGEPLGESRVWRSVPPPIGDRLFAAGRPLHRAPRAMSIGRSSRHREEMLTPSKHHHDLLQLLHGFAGADLREMLAECDVGVHVGREPGGRFGLQAGMHLAAGQLLLSEPLHPAHGLERDIDYLGVDSPEALEGALRRLARFPEMHERIRVRGRMKAEQFRASRLFGRLLHDLALDVAAFAASERDSGRLPGPATA
jgi:hypothetical protein